MAASKAFLRLRRVHAMNPRTKWPFWIEFVSGFQVVKYLATWKKYPIIYCLVGKMAVVGKMAGFLKGSCSYKYQLPTTHVSLNHDWGAPKPKINMFVIPRNKAAPGDQRLAGWKIHPIFEDTYPLEGWGKSPASYVLLFLGIHGGFIGIPWFPDPFHHHLGWPPYEKWSL